MSVSLPFCQEHTEYEHVANFYNTVKSINNTFFPLKAYGSVKTQEASVF